MALKRDTAHRRNWIPALYACLVAVAAVAGLWVRHADRPQPGAAQLALEIQRPRSNDEIACPKASSAGAPLVILALGQSNAGNHGSGRERSPEGALWFEAHCYPIADPLAGATGTEGSIWSRLGSLLSTRSGTPEIILSVLAVDATRISDWTRAGPLSDRLRNLLAALRQNQMVVSAVLWQQGEADARDGVGSEDYAAALGKLVRRLRDGGITAPVFLARSTRCHNAGSDEIRAGVSLAAATEVDVFLGPDTDAFGDELRRDGCHFNAAGLRHAAEAWRGVLAAHGIVPGPSPQS